MFNKLDFPKYLSSRMNLRVKKKKKERNLGSWEEEVEGMEKVENLVRINRACRKRISGGIEKFDYERITSILSCVKKEFYFSD